MSYRYLSLKSRLNHKKNAQARGKSQKPAITLQQIKIAPIWNSRILNNGTPTASSTQGAVGGGVYIYNAGPIVWNSVISGNVLPYYTGNNGGGVQMWNGGILRNCLLSGNRAHSGAGASVAGGGVMAYLENCTVVGNTASYHGAIAIQYAGGSTNRFTTIRNTICYLNTTDLQIYNGYNATNSFVTDSCVTTTNNLVGTGNITNNPQFVNSAGDDFRLAKGSPCIDMGLNQPWMDGVMDLDGLVRMDKNARIVDMGAYEFVPLPFGTVILVR